MRAVDLNLWRQQMDERPLAFSLVLSLVVHFIAFLLVLAWQRTALHNIPLAARIKQALVQQSATRALHPPKTEAKPKPKPAVEQETPMLFVEVDPQTIAPEPPKHAKYYSSVSSRAANPEPSLQSTVPKIDGRQDRIMRTFDSPRSRAHPLQPTPLPLNKAEPLKVQTANAPSPTVQRPAERPAEPAPQAQPKPGNTLLAKAEPTPAPQMTVGTGGKGSAREPAQAPAQVHERPRTLVAARAQQESSMAGERMRQQGGVSQRGKVALDVKGTAFGAYDAYIIAAIQQRWYALLDERHSAADRTGHVRLEFRLYYDGRVTDMSTTESTVGDLLAYICQKAVLDPAPFEKWPTDMRRMVGQDYRDVVFTFYYN